MATPFDPRRLGRSAPYQQETSTATLIALLLAVAVPALVVALAAGWRPLNAEQSSLLGQSLARLTGRGVAASTPPPADWALPDGWFFTQTRGHSGRPGGDGYAVTDAAGIPFWTEYQRLGGPTHVGYPLSGRFVVDGAATQVFQRAILRFDTVRGRVVTLPVLDRLHAEGHDGVLADHYGIPALELPAGADPMPEAITDRLDLVLADYPALRAALAAVPDVAALFGAPTSTVHDAGAFFVVRFQKGALQQWKQDVPWARRGDVTAVNVGEIAIALGLFPEDALAPIAAPRPAPASAR